MRSPGRPQPPSIRHQRCRFVVSLHAFALVVDHAGDAGASHMHHVCMSVSCILVSLHLALAPVVTAAVHLTPPHMCMSSACALRPSHRSCTRLRLSCITLVHHTCIPCACRASYVLASPASRVLVFDAMADLAPCTCIVCRSQGLCHHHGLRLAALLAVRQHHDDDSVAGAYDHHHRSLETA
jgi:hypothetical protein